jgi:hypothetical protein
MPNYLLAYHGGSMPEGEEAQAASLEAWNEWMDAVGDQLLDGGNPAGASRTVSSDGQVSETEGDRVTGYSIIEAEDIDAAVEIARGCPILADGGSVEVAELVDMAFDDEDDEDLDDEDD